MIGIWSSFAAEYLTIIAIATLIFFGLPMFIWPLGWAKVLGWEIPSPPDLAIYFGRCLGGVVSVMALLALLANAHPLTQQLYFKFILANFFVMVVVHVYGAIKRIQPILETYEIGYWILIFFITLLFYPQG